MTQVSGDFDKFDASWSRTMKLTGWTKKIELANFLGIKGQSVSGARTRNVFPADWAHRIAAEFGGNTDWILEGKGGMRHDEQGDISESPQPCPVCGDPEVKPAPQPCTIDTSGRVSIPRWQNPDPEMFDYIPMAEAKLSAGGGCFVLSEDIEDYYAFRKSWLSRVATSASNLVLMRIHGNSMSPTLEDGDTAMIDTGRHDIKDGMIYALRVDHSIMIKRLSFRVGGKVLIISDNRHEYEPYEAQMKDVHVIGQVIFFCRTFVSE